MIYDNLKLQIIKQHANTCSRCLLNFWNIKENKTTSISLFLNNKSWLLDMIQVRRKIFPHINRAMEFKSTFQETCLETFFKLQRYVLTKQEQGE